MQRPSQKSFRPAVVLLTTLFFCQVMAEVPDDFRSPGLAAFYEVDVHGRSVPVKPEANFVGSPVPSRSRTIVGLNQPEPRPGEVAPEARIVIRQSRSQQDVFEEARCNRFGFYYTRSGRCVIAGKARRVSRPQQVRR